MLETFFKLRIDMKGFCPLASGSKGNCIYLGTEKTKLLIDAGIGVRTIIERLKEIEVGLEQIDAILISHEHSDHIKSVEKLAANYQIPLFANAETAKAILPLTKIKPRFKIFSTGESFVFGDIKVHPFSIQHDTLDPVAFIFYIDGLKIGVCADLGFVTTLVISHLKQCDYLYIEANHEPSMVYACARPSIYKQRVLGRQGHLSNEHCAQLIKQISHPGLKHIYLAHLSKECNQEEVALAKVAKEFNGGPSSLSIAYQDKRSKSLKF